MKILLALAAVWVALCAADTNKVSDIRPERKPKTNLVEVLPTGHHPTNLLQLIRTNDFDFISLGNPHYALFAQDGTNICEMELSTNVTTQWLTIEQEEGQTHNRVKQIGVLVTNQVLMVTHDGATNEMVLKMLGREEWPSQKRTLMMSNMQNARQSR